MRRSGGAHWGTPALLGWREGRALAAGGGNNICVSVVGVYVGAENVLVSAARCVYCVCVSVQDRRTLLSLKVH